ncbi:MAG TPA: hypothetical protein VF702_03145 [Allosphingosinicella sp.]
MIGILFWMLALICCGHAILFGGRDGRWVSFVFLVTAGLTIPAGRLGKAWGETELLVLGVDLILLAGLYAVMLASRRYWPIWMVGFHLLAVVTHLSTMLTPDFTPRLYRAMGTFWVIPLLLSLLIGVELDRRAARKLRFSSTSAGEGAGREP